MVISKDLIQYIFIYLAVAAGGTGWIALIGNDNFVLLIFILGILFLLFYNRGRVDRRMGTAICLSVLFCLLAMTYSSLSIGSILNFIGKFIFSYAAIQIDKEKFIDKFLKLAYYLAAISLIVFFIVRIVGFDTFSPLFSYLISDSRGGADISGYGYGLFVYRFVPLHATRNCGIFTEPGEYAIYLSVAIYMLFANQEQLSGKDKSRYFVVYILTMLTVQSTAGYGLLLALIIFGLISGELRELIDRRIGIAILIVVLFLGNDIIEMYHASVTNKIITNGVVDLSKGTGGARTISIFGVLKYLSDNPIALLGMGYDNMVIAGIDGCAGLLATLASYGIFVFGSVYGYLIVYAWENRKSNSLFWLKITLFLIIGLSQPTSGFPVVYMLFMFNERISKQFICLDERKAL